MDWRLAASWAAVIVSMISVIINVWWPWHNRPQAGWQLTDIKPLNTLREQSQLYAILAEPEPSRVFLVSNSGDGDAYVVTFEGSGCRVEACLINDDGNEARVLTPSSVHRLRPGDQIYLRVWESTADGPETITIHWLRQPTWRDRHVHMTVAVRGTIEKQPLRPIPDPHDRRPPLWWFRLTHSARRHAARFSRTWSRQTADAHGKTPKEGHPGA